MQRWIVLAVAAMGLIGTSFTAVLPAQEKQSDKKQFTVYVKSVDVKAKEVVIIVSKLNEPEMTETLKVTDEVKVSWLMAKKKPGAITDIEPKDMIVVVEEDGKLTEIKMFKRPK